MVKLSGFADEISPDLDEQLKVLAENGIRFVDLRGVLGKNVSDLTDEEAARVKSKLDAAGVSVAAIGSPIGKVGIDEPFEPHLEKFKRVLDLAEAFETRYVRIFSYYVPEGTDPGKYRDEVIERMKAKAELAGTKDIVLTHENERGIYGQTPERCLDLIDSVASPNLRNLFDPANYVVCGLKPFDECWKILKNHTVFFHIKDARLDTGRITPAGHGDGDVRIILQDAISSGYEGFLTLEPHLAHAGKASGFTGPELFTTAVDALKSLLDEIEAEYA